LGKLLGMESDLAVLAAGIIHVENPLAMTLAAGASGTGDRRGMESVALQQGAAQQVVERGERGGELASGWGGCLARHLSRCYTQAPPEVNTFLSINVLVINAAQARYAGGLSCPVERGSFRPFPHQPRGSGVETKELSLHFRAGK
jgi:hypothetical protein